MEMKKTLSFVFFAILLVFGGASLWGAAESGNYQQKNDQIMKWVRGLKEGIRFLKAEGKEFTPVLQEFEEEIEFVNTAINRGRGLNEPEAELYQTIQKPFDSAWQTARKLAYDLRVNRRFSDALNQKNANLDAWFDLVIKWRDDLKDQAPYVDNIGLWRLFIDESKRYLNMIEQTTDIAAQLFYLGQAYVQSRRIIREEPELLTSKILQTVLGNSLDEIGSRSSDKLFRSQAASIANNLWQDAERARQDRAALARVRDYNFGELKRLEKASQELQQSYQDPEMPQGLIGVEPIVQEEYLPEWLQGGEPSMPEGLIGVEPIIQEGTGPEWLQGREQSFAPGQPTMVGYHQPTQKTSPLMQSSRPMSKPRPVSLQTVPSHQIPVAIKQHAVQKVASQLLSPKSLLKIDYGVRSEQGHRPAMEDEHAHAVTPDGRYEFFGVYDGHGGVQTAKALAHGIRDKQGDLKIKSFHDFIFPHLAGAVGSSLEIAAVLKQAVIDYDTWLENSLEDEEIDTAHKIGQSGSTAIAALVDKKLKTIYFMNLGDARGLLAQRDGSLAKLSRFEKGSFSSPQFDATVDHKLRTPEEKAKVEAAGGHVYLGRLEGVLAVSRAFGDFEFKRGDLASHMRNADIYMKKIGPDDRFMILGCDGIWDVVDTPEAAAMVAEKLNQGATAQQADDSLEDRALKDFDQSDNVTSMVIRFRTSAKR